MAKFLRDEHIKNVTVTEAVLSQVNDFLTERETSTNAELEKIGADHDLKLLLTYIIRFDGRGYKLNEFNDVLKYYAQAQRVERVIFILDSTLSEKTNRMYGAYFEFRLDSKDQNNTYVQAASDDGDAVDSVFCGLKEIVEKCKNKNGIIRNIWSQLLIQIFGVALGFLFSLLAGIKIAPYLKVENAFILTFLFAFLVFSNAWGFMNQQILRLLDYSFPNVAFSRKGKNVLHWLAQALVGGVVVTLTLLIVNNVFEWVGKVLGEYIAK